MVGYCLAAEPLVTLWLYSAVFVSLWCFFSAVLTIAICAWFWSLRDARVAGV